MARVRLIRLSTFRELERTGTYQIFRRWTFSDIHPRLANYILDQLHTSYSQIQQDLLVAYVFQECGFLDAQEKGYFVEFGACDGKSLSNTYLLETTFGWEGVLCEPGRIWKDDLSENRNCELDFRCLSAKSGLTAVFTERNDPHLSGIRGITKFDSDELAQFEVLTVSLNDLLIENKSPKTIDYMSIDTEGSEYEILKNFPISNWNIRFLTIEHNYADSRELIYAYMDGNGYKRIFPRASGFEDWYVSEKLFAELKASDSIFSPTRKFK